MLNRRMFILSGSSLGISGVLSGCSGEAEITQFDGPLGKYARVTIPANNINGADYTQVAFLEFGVDKFGRVVYHKDPQTGESLPVVVRVVYKDTFTKPGKLEVLGIIIPGLISGGFAYALQQQCINNGCGGSGDPVYIFNENINQAVAETAVDAISGGFCASGTC